MRVSEAFICQEALFMLSSCYTLEIIEVAIIHSIMLWRSSTIHIYHIIDIVILRVILKYL